MPPFAAEHAPCPTLPISPAPEQVSLTRAPTGLPAFDPARPQPAPQARARGGVEDARVDWLAGLGSRARAVGRVARGGEVPCQGHPNHRVPLFLAGGERHAVADESRVVDEDVEVAVRVDRGP